MPAETMQIAAGDIVARQRHQVPHLLRIQPLRHETLSHRVAPRVPVAPHLRLIHGDTNAVSAKLGRIAEQLVHHRPEPLFLLEQRTDRMRASTSIAP